LEYHGGPAGGWCIVAGSLTSGSVVVDIGVGEDTSFTESIINRYGCMVHGFDLTPRAIRYVKGLANDRLQLHPVGIGTTSGLAYLFLPNNDAHVSGALTRERHLRCRAVEVELITIGQVCETLACDRIDLLKMDIEGTEFVVIGSEEFRRRAPSIGQFCVEFHHRWRGRGKRSADNAAGAVRRVGFECAWYSRTTNEEFLFVRAGVRA